MISTVPETILIPVETLNREFDGKLLLALMAAERGFKSIIGGRTLMHERLHEMPRSIYLSKGIRSGSRAISGILEKLGHIIVALDEEALVRFPDDVFLMKLDEETFNRARILFAWGKSNADVWRKFKGYRNTPITETGNPRFDLLRPEVRSFYEPRANELRRRYGNFTLLSSNFSFVNHFIPHHVRYNVARDAPKAKVDEARTGFQSHKRTLFDHFLALVPVLASAIAPDKLVIRPHPSEGSTVWMQAAAGLPNVEVIHEGPMAPWLMAAKALVHNGCTSSIEATLLGTPAFAFMPVTSQEHDLALPNSLSQQASSVEDLCEGIRQCRERPRLSGPSAKQRLILDQHVDSIGGPLACERIIDSLIEKTGALLSGPQPTNLNRLFGLVLHHRRNAVRLIRTRRKLSKSSANYTRHKFPTISLADVRARHDRFRQALGKFDQMEIREMSPNLFAVERR